MNFSPRAPPGSLPLVSRMRPRQFVAHPRDWLARLVLASVLMVSLSSAAAVPPGDPYLVRSWSANDGLRDLTINDLEQTSDGYLWISTYGGVARFDGMRFKFFDKDTTPALGTRMIGGLLADAAGRLWLINARGELILEEQEDFRMITLPLASDGSQDACVGIQEIGADHVWLLTRSGRTHAWVKGTVRPDEGQRLGVPLGAFARTGGAPGSRWFWMDAPDRSNRRHHGQVIDGRFSAVAAADGTREWHSLCYAPRRAGGVWFLDDNDRVVTLRALLPDGSISAGQTLPRNLLQGGVASLAEDQEGAFWLGTGRGVIRWQREGEARIFTTREGLANDNVRAVLVDAENNVWAGTEGGGLSRITPQAFQVRGAGFGIIQSVLAANDGGLWVATHGQGVRRWQAGEFAPVPGVDAFALSLHLDGAGELWSGGLLSGLHHLRHGEMTRLPVSPPVRAMLNDPTGGIWVAGAKLEHVQAGKIEAVPGWTSPAGPTSLALDRQGALWVGTGGDGLWARKQGRFSQYTVKDGLAHSEVSALYLDLQDTLWVGTVGGGVTRLRNGVFRSLTPAAGLWDRSICGIAEDGLGNFWFSSYNGIFRVARQELEDFCDGRRREVRSFPYNQDDGLVTAACISGSQPKITRDATGRLWFATALGVATVDPARLTMNTNPPPVVIEEVILDRAIIPGNGPAGWRGGAPLVIGPGARRLEIAYTAPSFRAPEKVRYQYRLEGRDEEWTDARSSRFASFDRLRPGGYVFHVIAANGDWVWNRTGARLAFTVQPFFWQTLWFRVLASGAVLALAAGVVRQLAVRKYRRRLEVLERQRAVDQERARIARDMHDDVGASLTQITMLGLLARTDLAEPERAANHLAQLGDLSQEVVGKLDELVWVVNPRNDTVAGLAEYLGQYTEQLLRAAQIRCRFDFPAALPHLPLNADTRHQVFLAVKEALNNVMKHAAATEVHLGAVHDAGILTFTIEDNGRGFAYGRQGQARARTACSISKSGCKPSAAVARSRAPRAKAREWS